VKHVVIQRPRFATRAIGVARYGLPSTGRYRRYILSMLLPFLAIWLATVAWLSFAPVVYESQFTLILPGSGAGGSLNVESIGQAESASSSAFSSTTLSPTENYKRLLMADVTMRVAAKYALEDAGNFPEPAIKLVDQTNLIGVEITGSSPLQAQRRAKALRKAFLEQLDRLRADEASKREESDIKHLTALEAKVRETQGKLLEFQASNGLVSLEQFNNRISNIDALKDREREARTAYRQRSAQSARYGSALGTAVHGANLSLRLRSDPVFQKLVERYAALDADAEQKSATLGDAHADMAQAASERETLRTAMADRGRDLTGMNAATLLQMVDLSVSDGRSNLFEGLIQSDAEKAGARAGLAEIRSDLAQQQSKSAGWVEQASVLADLTRDHRVAEAVFSTALARIDTNKQDPFASYPLVQSLEEPSLPRQPSSPSLMIALGGAIAASLLLFIGFMLTWFRQPILDKLLPKG
jgi:uncharacterized protein involved in exopolysaccharide biosynthesis